MNRSYAWAVRALPGLLLAASGAWAQGIADLSCSTPPVSHYAESCSPELLRETGNVIEPETGRAFFLDYPCDLTPDEDYLLILSLHGAGRIGN